MKNAKNYRERYLNLSTLYQQDAELQKIKEQNLNLEPEIFSTFTKSIQRSITSNQNISNVNR